MNSLIDIHILKHPIQDRSAQQEKLYRELSQLPEVQIHLVEGIDRHIGCGRKKGFLLGDAPYVSFCDDDDEIIKDVIPQALEVLQQNINIDAIVTDEFVNEKGRMRRLKKALGPKNGELFSLAQCRFIHHLVIFRRSSLNPYLRLLDSWPDMAELSLYATMIKQECKFMYLDIPAYIWNVHDKGARSLGIEISKESQKLLLSVLK